MSLSPVLDGLATVRSHTWPPTAHRRRLLKLRSFSTTPSAAASILSTSMTSSLNDSRFDRDRFEDELNANPDAHFLSPMQLYEYEDWADDSGDDDADEVEWNAGITDFALFDRDRRNASERREDVPGKWQSFFDSQASALQRAVERKRADGHIDPQDHRRTPPVDDLPHLTPDNSPNLRDDFDLESFCGGRVARPCIPDYLNEAPVHLPSKVFSPTYRLRDDEKDDLDLDDVDFDDDGLSMSQYDDDDASSIGTSDSEADVPVSVLVQRARQRRMEYRKQQRPGLRYNRTMSGRAHVWRRPSQHIYTVGEDVEAEAL